MVCEIEQLKSHFGVSKDYLLANENNTKVEILFIVKSY